MQRRGLDLQQPLAPGRRRPARLLDDPGHGIGLVYQPQAPIAESAPLIAGVKVNAAARDDAEDVDDGRAGPAHVEVATTGAFLAAAAVLDVSADGIVPVARVGIVDRVLA